MTDDDYKKLSEKEKRDLHVSSSYVTAHRIGWTNLWLFILLCVVTFNQCFSTVSTVSEASKTESGLPPGLVEQDGHFYQYKEVNVSPETFFPKWEKQLFHVPGCPHPSHENESEN